MDRDMLGLCPDETNLQEGEWAESRAKWAARLCIQLEYGQHEHICRGSVAKDGL
jgi:hypothetical protein